MNETRTKLKAARWLQAAVAGAGTRATRRDSFMKMAKATRRQAQTAERVALTTADALVANQMRSLARAFRSQADILKRKEKKKKK
ncbi:hypothetical protein ACVWZM_008229 [Bradyrhizobium sp. USDA 4501]